MKETWYEVCDWQIDPSRIISELTVVRRTNRTLWFEDSNGRTRQLRINNDVFPTKAQAQEEVLRRAEERLEAFRHRVTKIEGEIAAYESYFKGEGK